jgi:hypothetical protein
MKDRNLSTSKKLFFLKCRLNFCVFSSMWTRTLSVSSSLHAYKNFQGWVFLSDSKLNLTSLVEIDLSRHSAVWRSPPDRTGPHGSSLGLRVASSRPIGISHSPGTNHGELRPSSSIPLKQHYENVISRRGYLTGRTEPQVMLTAVTVCMWSEGNRGNPRLT